MCATRAGLCDLTAGRSCLATCFGALTPDVAVKGLIAGSSLMFGAFIAKRFVLHLQPNMFRLLMDGIMLVAGLSMFWNAFWN